jgi:hypothetical protein
MAIKLEEALAEAEVQAVEARQVVLGQPALQVKRVPLGKPVQEPLDKRTWEACSLAQTRMFKETRGSRPSSTRGPASIALAWDKGRFSRIPTCVNN